MNSALVVHDNKGKTYSVRYDQVNAMFLNEFIKEQDPNLASRASSHHFISIRWENFCNT